MFVDLNSKSQNFLKLVTKDLNSGFEDFPSYKYATWKSGDRTSSLSYIYSFNYSSRSISSIFAYSPMFMLISFNPRD